MQKTTVLITIIVGLLGFISGFLLANFLNRSDIQNLRARNDGISIGQSATPGASVAPSLSSEEIRSKIDEADRNPENFEYQKDLGLALYRYAAMTQDPDVLEHARRLLERAASLNGNDYHTLVGLGHAEFDIGFFKKDLSKFEKAREIYARALKMRPNDPDIQTDMGISYFVQEPPAYDRAEAELKKVAAIDPKHERSLQFLIQVYARQKRIPEAKATLERLRGLNPANTAIKELSSLIDKAESEVG
jgi:tetratricopeptide (TPR) repeat protein